MSEAWVTDSDLRSAWERFAAQLPGLVMPVAYGVARKDASGLTFGHVNAPGAVRPLPAVVLALRLRLRRHDRGLSAEPRAVR